ncbi:MAG: hypothetical protein M1383_05345 [Patescibacteria group bacterium]|nr:hypothetical protein [Patescibacteria group bacterium]
MPENDGTNQPLLPEFDIEFLDEKQYKYKTISVNGMVHLTIEEFLLPPQKYNLASVKLLIRVPAGYPNANPDMFYTYPDVKLANGNLPDKADVHETYDEIPWQRWSRHLSQSQWRAGKDNLRTYISSIKNDLSK